MYDIEADRTELNNLAAIYPTIAGQMIGKYEKWASRVGVINWQERKNKVITQKIVPAFNEINKKLKEHAIMKL